MKFESVENYLHFFKCCVVLEIFSFNMCEYWTNIVYINICLHQVLCTVTPNPLFACAEHGIVGYSLCGQIQVGMSRPLILCSGSG